MVLRETVLVCGRATDWAVLQARAKALCEAIARAAARIRALGMEEEAVAAALGFASSDRVSQRGLHVWEW